MRALTQLFIQNLKNQRWYGGKFLVAVSGGVDSMVLATLFYLAEQKIVLAHCNFGLRAAESDGDELLVKNWAEQNKIPFYTKPVPIPQIIKENGGNTEETARRLRYEWFEKLRQELNLDFIAVAHHREDAVETLLINFFRGTGISGLHGILPQRGEIIRPLLDFTKQEIIDFAQAKGVQWREDSSNRSDDYLRNRLRHHLIPQIEQVFPNAASILYKSTQWYRDVELIYETAVQGYQKDILEKRGKDWVIPVLKIKQLPFAATLLFELLKPFGFSGGQSEDIAGLMEGETGKFVASEQYLIYRDRHFLVITAKDSSASSFFRIDYPVEEIKILLPQGWFSMSSFSPSSQPALSTSIGYPKRELIALQQKDFPLSLRKIKEGDYFYPLGMRGKKKKVGKFLRDLKIAPEKKKDIWVLESKRRIVWVVGLRLDERFKLNSLSEQVFEVCVGFEC